MIYIFILLLYIFTMIKHCGTGANILMDHRRHNIKIADFGASKSLSVSLHDSYIRTTEQQHTLCELNYLCTYIIGGIHTYSFNMFFLFLTVDIFERWNTRCEKY